MSNLIYKISNPNCSSCNNNKNTSRSLNVDKSPYLTFAIPDSTSPQALNLGVTKWLGISFIAMGELTYKNNERVYIQPIIFPEKDFLYMNGNELGI